MSILKATVYSIKATKSGNHDIITLVTNEVSPTTFGSAVKTTYYNLLIETGSATVEQDAAVDLDLSLFDVETSQLDKGVSRWLRAKS